MEKCVLNRLRSAEIVKKDKIYNPKQGHNGYASGNCRCNAVNMTF